MSSAVDRVVSRPLREETSDETLALLRIAIGAQLRTWRTAARISRSEMGKLLGVAVPEARAIEDGLTPVSEQDVQRLLARYGITGKPLEDFLAVVRHDSAGGELWHRDHVDPSSFDPYSAAVRSAQLIRLFAPDMVPPLLQTPDYARATARLRCMSRQAVERQIELAEEHSAALLSEPVERLWVVLGAEAVTRPVAGPDIQRRQVDHLLKLADTPTVALQIVPAGDSQLLITNGPFTIFRFNRLSAAQVVHLPQLTGSLYLENRADVEVFMHAWDWLAVAAQSPAQTRKSIAQMRMTLG